MEKTEIKLEEMGLKGEVTIERLLPGKPHSGKVLAVIFPHADDFSIFTGGLIAKLIDEGYTGYFIRTTNDEMDSYDLSMGETVQGNERDTQKMAQVLGIKQVFDLNYRNHYLDEVPPTEIRNRLVLLFRMLKVDTVVTFDPWGHYERNPDHYATARAVEAASWMTNGRLDEPEQLEMGLKPQRVGARYYYARGLQVVNRVVDISPFIQRKLEALCANKTQVGNMMNHMRAQLAAQGRKLPILDTNNETAIRNYAEVFLLEESRSVGREYGLKYAERFYYYTSTRSDYLEYQQDYIDKNAVPLK